MVVLLLCLVDELGVYQRSLQVWRFFLIVLLRILIVLLALALVQFLVMDLFLLALVGLVVFFVKLEANHGGSLLKLCHSLNGVILRRLGLLLCAFSFDPGQVLP